MPGRSCCLRALWWASAVLCLATVVASWTEAAQPDSLPTALVVSQDAPAPQLVPSPDCDLFPERDRLAAQRFYFTGEYLMWWLKNSPQPVPLVTSVPAALIPPSWSLPTAS